MARLHWYRSMAFLFVVSILGISLALPETTVARQTQEPEHDGTTVFMEGPYKAERVEPTTTDLNAIAELRGVAVEKVHATSAACWQSSYRVDQPQGGFWAKLTMHWCYDYATGQATSIWGYPTHDVTSLFYWFNSVSGPFCGPNYSYPATVASCHSQWHFESSFGPGPNLHYYPWITIYGTSNGLIWVSYHI